MNPEIISFSNPFYLAFMATVVFAAFFGKNCERVGAYGPARNLFIFTTISCLAIVGASGYTFATTTYDTWTFAMLFIWSWITFLSVASLRRVWVAPSNETTR